MSEQNSSSVNGETDFDTINVAAGLDVTGKDGTIETTNAAHANSSERVLDFARLRLDLHRNPRRKGRYDVKEIGWLARSIFLNGLLEPVVVSQRDDGSLWVLKGHLRTTAIMIVRTVGVPAVGKSEPAIPADPHFMDKIKCRVLKNLSAQDELDLVMDHGTVTPLDRREKYVAGKTMRRAGFTQARCAEKLGLDRSVFSKLDWVMQMPPVVEEMFLAEPSKTTPKITDTVISALFTAYNADQAHATKLGIPLRFREGGANFAEALEKVANGTGVGPVKSIPSGKLIEVAKRQDDRDIMDLLNAIALGNEQDLGAAIARLEIRLIPVETLGGNAGDETADEEIEETVEQS